MQPQMQLQLPPISITSATCDTRTIKNAVEEYIGLSCIADIESVYITDTKMTHFITFKKVDMSDSIKQFILDLGGCVPISYKKHTFIAVSNFYDV